MTHRIFVGRARMLTAVWLTVMAMVMTVLALPAAAGAQTQPPNWVTKIDIANSCLSDRGRIDVEITVDPNAIDTSVIHTASVVVGRLAPRTRNIDPNRPTRVTVTGRPDGTLPVSVAIDGVVVKTADVVVDCSADLAVPELKTSCLAGFGRVDVYTPQGRDYVVSFPGLANRTIKGVNGRMGRTTFTGRRDGVYSVRVAPSSGTPTNLTASVVCEDGPPAGELEVITSCLANRGRVDVIYRTEVTAKIEVIVGNLAPRVHSAQAGQVIRETVTGRPDGRINIALKENGLPLLDVTHTIKCAPTTTQQSLSLQAYDDCPAFLGDIKTKALEYVDAFGLGYGYGYFPGGPVVDAPEIQAAAPTDFSETNNQVEGVDEPDLMKTNGEVLLVAENNTVHLYSVTGGNATEYGSVTLETPVDAIFFDGSKNAVAVSGYRSLIASDAAVIGPYGPDNTFTLTQLAVTAPGAGSDENGLVKGSTLTMDGTYLDARFSDGLIRLVSRSTPNLDFATPTYPFTEATLAEAEAANRQVIQDSRVSDWLGTYELTELDGSTTSRTISNCRDMFVPEPFGGFSSTAVTTIDPATMTVTPGPGLLSDADTVYASADSLYLASQPWPSDALVGAPQVLGAPIDSTYTTQLHKFDISQTTPTYEGTGRVRGHLLNQFAMHEYDGRLFVASTDGAIWWGNTEEAQSYVTVLEPSDGRLNQVGQVGNLGAGERIFAVRYIDDVAYVVTFRQTDPLYVVDLRDPTAPKVTGELKIPGYSAYLHPIGDGRLLGVGADADDQGVVKGAKLSVFDVSDPAKPTETATWVKANSKFAAEWDHHAFTWWGPRNYAILPAITWGDIEGQTTSSVFSVTGSAITEVGTLASSGFFTAQRSTVIGDRIWTLTDKALLGNRLDDLSPTQQIPF